MSNSPLSLPLSAAGSPGESPRPGLNLDGNVYAPVAGAASPISNSGSPTAREVRLECKAGESPRNGLNLDGTVAYVPVTSGSPGGPKARSRLGVEEAEDKAHGNGGCSQIQPPSPKVVQPRGRKLLIAGCATILLAGAAVSAVVLCKVWSAPKSGQAAPPPPPYQRVGNGTCAGHGLQPIQSSEICAKAAKALGLTTHKVMEVPRDAVAGLAGSTLPEDCYIMTLSQPKHKQTALFFNKYKASNTKASGSARLLAAIPDVPGLAREPLCRTPEFQLHQHAQRAVKKEEAAPWGLQQVPAALAQAEGAVAALVLGTTTTTTHTATSTTKTGTTSTVSSTTATTSTSTGTSTTETSTSVTSTSSTSSMTTTYHDFISLFCFSVMRVNSYELNNVRTALAKKTSIFGCDEYTVFSDTPYELKPGVPVPGWGELQAVDGPSVKTTILRQDLTTHPKAGALEGILNTRIFMQAWHQISEEGRFRYHDWTIKVDPDAVFLPTRLRSDLKEIAPPTSPAKNLYLVNCKISFGLFGAVEVFSTLALENYLAGEDRCKRELDWTMMGEDLWMRKCFDLLGVQHDDDFNLLSDGYCSDAPSPCQSGKAAFHPFKTALSYFQCYKEAITPTTTTTTSTGTNTSTTTAEVVLTRSKSHHDSEEDDDEVTKEDEEKEDRADDDKKKEAEMKEEAFAASLATEAAASATTQITTTATATATAVQAAVGAVPAQPGMLQPMALPTLPPPPTQPPSILPFWKKK